MTEKLAVNGLDTSYIIKKNQKFTALSNISFTVSEGEFVTILGPSGCGKSTLLDVIAGLLKPEKGEVRINGKEVGKPSLEVGFVMQSYALFPWRTVRKNIEYGLELKKVPKKDRREIAEKYLSLVNLGDFADRYPYELSGGMKQRVAIVRALAYNPNILLMDEPFAAVDAQTREGLQDELLNIWEQTKKTIVFVTHSIEEAVILSDRVIVLTENPGTIKAIKNIELVRPRNSDIRGTIVFRDYVQQFWKLLHKRSEDEDVLSEGDYKI
ncbi:MAG: ABC transporter ATP-binding protein [Clostridiales Family XIII bacterium]|nr:ABC transporter ATP-binding protein [Clostridiales Family XIII bacterium]